MHSKRLITVLVVLALALPASPAHAGGVVSVCDETHLKAALAGGGTVTFACSGTIVLTSTIAITADTTIDGSGQAVTISGNNSVRVFSVSSGKALALNRLTVANGNSGYGGGIHNAGTLTVSNSIFSGNSASTGGWGGGGGIYNVGNLTVRNSTFSGNSAYYDGGGIFSPGGTVTVSSSIFSGNSAPHGGGGGIENSGTLTVTNSTFSGNSANFGGGIDTYLFGTTHVNNSTFSGNNAAINWGGSIYSQQATTILKNTLISSLPSVNNCLLNIGGTIIDGGGNLSYPDDGVCPGIHSDPLLGPLQDNGGPTLTYALLPGSPAIDAGLDPSCPSTDQRGLPRPRGVACDIGSFETQPPLIYVDKHAPGPVHDGSSWAQAFTDLQPALAAASTDSEIWVAAGTYYPSTNDPAATFSLQDGTALYGGFAGHESLLSQRDWSANPTILSGDIDQNDGSGGPQAGNSYRVVSAVNAAHPTAIDGFIIRRAYNNRSTWPAQWGGGLYVVASRVIARNIAFDNNYAAAGAGMFIYNTGALQTELANVVFIHNHASINGGGLHTHTAKARLTNVTFYDNSADASGGGIYNYGNSVLTVINTILWGNSASQGAEIFNNAGCSLTVTYSDIAGSVWSGTGNINEDPEFVDPDNGDLRLKDGSPAIDAGDSSAVAGLLTDLDGNPRVVDGDRNGEARADMGAYEYLLTLYLPLIRK